MGSSTRLGQRESESTSHEGAHARLDGEAERKLLHCTRDGTDWRMAVETPVELANDIKFKLAAVRGKQVRVQQEKRNGRRHSIQLHTPKAPACWVCQEADVAIASKGSLPVGEPETALSLGMDMAGPLPESLDDEQWLLKVNDRKCGLKWAMEMNAKSAKSVLKLLRACISQIKHLLLSSRW